MKGKEAGKASRNERERVAFAVRTGASRSRTRPPNDFTGARAASNSGIGKCALAGWLTGLVVLLEADG